MSEHLLINVFNIDAALAVGRAQGFFAADGLDVDVIVTPNSTDQMRGLGKEFMADRVYGVRQRARLVGTGRGGVCRDRAGVGGWDVAGLRSAGD